MKLMRRLANPTKRLSSLGRELNMSGSGGRVKPLTAESDGHTTPGDGSRGVPEFPRAVAPTQKEFPWQLSTPVLRPGSWDRIVGRLVILVIGGHREGRCRSGGPPGRDGARPGRTRRGMAGSLRRSSCTRVCVCVDTARQGFVTGVTPASPNAAEAGGGAWRCVALPGSSTLVRSAAWRCLGPLPDGIQEMGGGIPDREPW